MKKGHTTRRSWPLFKFDQPFLHRYGCVAGVDEAGRGPLAGPVVAAAVILPPEARIPCLADSKLLTPEQRRQVYRHIQRVACAIGVGIVEVDDIDRLNIYWASFLAMRLALAALVASPAYVLVDGFRIPDGPACQSGIVDGDRKSARIAAASIVAKVTRDAMMQHLDTRFPGYGFAQHKGYSTPGHLRCLDLLGPSPIHRRSFAPVRLAESMSE
jgi:ribonuclease HII